MIKKIIKLGIIPFIIILVAFSYVTLADDPEINGAGIEIEELNTRLLLGSSQIVDPINPAMTNVVAFDISNGQDTNDFTGFINDLIAMGYTVATIDITIDIIPDNVEKLIIASLSNDYALTEAYTLSEAELI